MYSKSQFLTELFHVLNDAEIDYFVYGEYVSLPDDTGGSDLDMYVNPEHIKSFQALFLGLLKKYHVSILSYYTNTHASFYRISSTQFPFWGIQIDIEAFSHKGKDYYPVEYVRKDIIKHHHIKVIERHKGFYVNFLKEVIHNGRVKEKYRQAFTDYVTNNKDNCAKELTKLYGNRFWNEVSQVIMGQKLDYDYRQLQRSMRHHVHGYDLLMRMWAYICGGIVRLTQRPGYVIAVEGTDGSGKSTIINHLTPWLDEVFHHEVYYTHLRPHVIPDLGVLLGTKSEHEAGVVNSEPHAQKPSGFWGSIVRWAYYMTDYTFGYMKKVWPAIHIRSKVFIFDRYYYDYYIDQRRSRTTLPTWIIRIGEFLVPSPDLIVCLGGDPQKIYERKPETSLEEVTRQTLILQDFCQKRTNAVWVNTTEQLETSVNAAIKAVVEMMSARFRKNGFE